jgi:quercetin dioxygenase-like cupin family protein
MKKISFLEEISFNSQKVEIKKMGETAFSKEIRICMAKDNVMQEHTAPGAITILLINGKVQIASLQESVELTTGDMVYFDAKIPHSLKAFEDSIIRPTLSKNDSVQRVFSLVNGE